MKSILVSTAMFFCTIAVAQKPAQLIEQGNQDYRKKDYAKAGERYNLALSKQRSNAIALFNSGNANHRLKQFDRAAEYYEAAAATTTDPLLKAQAYYNLGLAEIGRQQTQAAIDAFKSSLRLNPNDSQARENLQKALKQVRQQQQEQDEEQRNKNQEKSKNKAKPQQQKGRLSKEDAEKMLDELRREEKNLQKEVQRKNQSARQLKDW